MSIIIIVRILYSVIFLFCALGLFAAPLERGFALAPGSSASPEERSQAYINARLSVIETARRYEGTPYRHGGTTAAGLDCSGFIVLIFREALGITPPRTSSGLYTWSVLIPLERAQPGDFLFFTTGTGRSITHVALYLGNRRFIHSASSGAETGVIISSMDEPYWAGTFASAGRAFPEVTPFSVESNPVITGNTVLASVNSGEQNTSGSRHVNLPPVSPANTSSENGRLLVGVGVAPSWNGFITGGELLRGFSSQFFLYADTYTFGSRMVFGLEIRPEYDDGLGVFRLPITFSWGPNEKFRIFAGPAFSFGDASISTGNGERQYSGGTSFLGNIGFTAAPFVINSPQGEFAPYFEMAWQSYFSNNNRPDPVSDLSAGFRFSTGVRWLFQIR